MIIFKPVTSFKTSKRDIEKREGENEGERGGGERKREGEIFFIPGIGMSYYKSRYKIMEVVEKATK